DILKMYAMRKESSLHIYRPITSARIPLQIRITIVVSIGQSSEEKEEQANNT
ncbi:32828_t:CDS:2, partial [Racocetra persica]